MKKQVSSPYTQLTLNFEFEASTTAPVQQPGRVEYTFSQSAIDESLATERDFFTGRSASLYHGIQRELDFLRKQAQILNQFEVARASIYC